jgi:hypothetical protein
VTRNELSIKPQSLPSPIDRGAGAEQVRLSRKVVILVSQELSDALIRLAEKGIVHMIRTCSRLNDQLVILQKECFGKNKQYKKMPSIEAGTQCPIWV